MRIFLGHTCDPVVSQRFIKHMTITEKREADPDAVSSASRIVATIRNPFEWRFRIWCWLKTNVPASGFPQHVVEKASDLNFCDWVRWCDDSESIPKLLAAAQCEYLDASVSIIHLETIAHDVREVLGLNWTGIHAHKTIPQIDYRSYYDDTSKDIVARRYQRDIEELGYEF